MIAKNLDKGQRNRITNPDISVPYVVIQSADFYYKADLNTLMGDLAFGNQILHKPFEHLDCDSGASSKQGVYVFQDNEITLNLSAEPLIRLLARCLKPTQYFVLKEKFGVFFEIHDDFYDEDSGESIQPMFEEEQIPEIVRKTKEAKK